MTIERTGGTPMARPLGRSLCQILAAASVALALVVATLAPIGTARVGAAEEEHEVTPGGPTMPDIDPASIAWFLEMTAGNMPAGMFPAAAETVAVTEPLAVEAAPPPPSTGSVVAGFAMMFAGYPYVWAGNTPAGFDCSGFTQYVVLNTLGIDISHGVPNQAGFGWSVDWGMWAPGDLVFFQNTYGPGISHVGIYIGDGLFIHAENEGTGVVITSMYSGYYSAHYWGAKRLA
ncbi:MAG: C40 family peptidase [Chloroflexota bacterium]|nr:C40 family peptidase [Chloroflexota bacterium]